MVIYEPPGFQLCLEENHNIWAMSCYMGLIKIFLLAVLRGQLLLTESLPLLQQRCEVMQNLHNKASKWQKEVCSNDHSICPKYSLYVQVSFIQSL